MKTRFPIYFSPKGLIFNEALFAYSVARNERVLVFFISLYLFFISFFFENEKMAMQDEKTSRIHRLKRSRTYKHDTILYVAHFYCKLCAHD